MVESLERITGRFGAKRAPCARPASQAHIGRQDRRFAQQHHGRRRERPLTMFDMKMHALSSGDSFDLKTRKATCGPYQTI